MEEVFGELGELSGAEERLGVDHVGREDFGVAVLAGVEVEHEVGEGALESRALPIMHNKTGAGDFCGAFEVEDAEALRRSPSGARRGSRRWGACPRVFLRVFVLGLTDGN